MLNDKINQTVEFIQKDNGQKNINKNGASNEQNDPNSDIHDAIRPKIGIVLGSGLGALADRIQVRRQWDYANLPNFSPSRMPGHAGRLLLGTLEDKEIVCMQGRIHGYEGHSAADIAFPIQVMQALGARTLIVTNAAGAINVNFSTGDIMLISDHINFTAQNPITLSVDNMAAIADGATSMDMSYTYTKSLRTLAKSVALELGFDPRTVADPEATRQNTDTSLAKKIDAKKSHATCLHEGVYLGLRGPTFETPAEIRAFRILGADAVGMSTIHEVLAARVLGMRILGVSLLTNMAAGMEDKSITGDEVLEVSAANSEHFVSLLSAMIRQMPQDYL